MAVFNGELIAAGLFDTAGGSIARNIARWNGNAWAPLGSGLTNGIVTSLIVYNGELIAAGSFDTAGGVSARKIARWNGSNWAPLDGQPINGTSIYALANFNGNLVATGDFYITQTEHFSRCHQIPSDFSAE